MGPGGLAVTLLRVSRTGRAGPRPEPLLGIDGEPASGGSSLSCPKSAASLTVEEALGCEAVTLFAQRAQAVQAEFTLTTENIEQVCQACQRLDGIPLAIELAAARLGALSFWGSSLARLDDLSLLTGGNRTPCRASRHYGPRWTGATSCSARPSVCFPRLAVFAGGWTLEAAEVVCRAKTSQWRRCWTCLPGWSPSRWCCWRSRAGRPLSIAGDGAPVCVSAVAGERGDSAAARPASGLAGGAGGRSRTAPRRLTPGRMARSPGGRTGEPPGGPGLEQRDTARVEQGMRLAAPLYNWWNTRGHAREGRHWLEQLLATNDPVVPKTRQLRCMRWRTWPGHRVTTRHQEQRTWPRTALFRVGRPTRGGSSAAPYRLAHLPSG